MLRSETGKRNLGKWDAKENRKGEYSKRKEKFE